MGLQKGLHSPMGFSESSKLAVLTGMEMKGVREEVCSVGGEALLETTETNCVYVYVYIHMYTCMNTVLVIYVNVITSPYCEGVMCSFQEF